MRTILILLLLLLTGVVAAVGLPAAAAAAETPFPSPKVQQAFVAGQTVTAAGAVITQVAPGGTVVFRAYAIDGKTHKTVTAKDVKYFYVTIPNQPNVKLAYNPTAAGATLRLAWTGTWTVPANYPSGIVNYKVLVQTKTKQRGQFVPLPVASSVLTIVGQVPTVPVGGAPGGGAGPGTTLDASLYVDSVNGTRPAGAPARPVGCTQTNVFRRGEQFVLRAWGSEMANGSVLSSDNVSAASFTVPGVAAPITLNWGLHGATTSRVYFWTNFWNIPADYPLGTTTVHITFKTDSGKTGTYDHVLNIIP
jgi:hypothetical protein